jgi:hypothetical protein
VSTVDIPKIETSEHPGINSPELSAQRAPDSVHGGHGGWLLLGGTGTGAGDAAFLASGTARWR